MTVTTYAVAHLDGAVVANSVQVGVLFPSSSPVARVTVVAGGQRHPVWAVDRVAVVFYAYCRAAKQHEYLSLQVNITGVLVSDERASSILARSVNWHTSAIVRADAEREIAVLSNGAPWPSECLLVPPVAFDVQA